MRKQKKLRFFLSLPIVCVAVLVLAWYGFFDLPQGEDVDYDSISRQDLAAMWSIGDVAKRRLIVESLVGEDWDGHSLVEFDLNRSRLYGMDREEVYSFLGPAEVSHDGYCRYSLGEEPLSRFRDWLEMGWERGDYALTIEFEKSSGKILRIRISD